MSPDSDEGSASKAEKIEQFIALVWEVEGSPQLEALAKTVWHWGETAFSETTIRQRLAAYHVREFGKTPNRGDVDRIIEKVNKVLAGYA